MHAVAYVSSSVHSVQLRALAVVLKEPWGHGSHTRFTPAARSRDVVTSHPGWQVTTSSHTRSLLSVALVVSISVPLHAVRGLQSALFSATYLCSTCDG